MSEEPAELTSQHYRLSGRARTGIEIGLNIVVRVGRARTEPERRAMIWCANYARYRRLSADALSEELGLEKATIRAALTDPDAEMGRFVAAIQRKRAEFEASIPTLADTAPTRMARRAVAFACKRPALVEYVAHSRMGKSTTIENEWLRLLDRAIYIVCPGGDSERELHEELARALGISCNTGKKSHQVRPQILSCFAPDMLTLVIVDEAHRLWPSNPRGKKPKRLEFLRDIYLDGKGASVVVCATPQHSSSLLLAMEDNPRWSPDQWYGRRVPFYAADSMSLDDLRAIARRHAPEFDEPLIELLAQQAMACDGYAGLVVNTINLARDAAEAAGQRAVTAKILEEVELQMSRGSRIEQVVERLAPKPAKKPKLPAPRFNGHGHAAPTAALAAGQSHTVRL